MTMHDLGPHWWQDSNGVKLQVTMTDTFFTSAIQHHNGRLSLHNSDPQQAVNICISKFCHHFAHGQLYKCGVTGLLPDFTRQFDVDVTPEDQALIDAYIPADASWSDADLKTFLQGLKKGKAVEQCKFCPSQYQSIRFDSTTKKIKLQKI
jgi:hypothetical protein